MTALRRVTPQLLTLAALVALVTLSRRALRRKMASTSAMSWTPSCPHSAIQAISAAAPCTGRAVPTPSSCSTEPSPAAAVIPESGFSGGTKSSAWPGLR